MHLILPDKVNFKIYMYLLLLCIDWGYMKAELEQLLALGIYL